MTLILFTTSAPSALAAELSRSGFSVYEALAISEVLALAAEHSAAQIVVTADVEPERAQAIQQHHPTLHLKAGATAADVVWEIGLIRAGHSTHH